MIADASTRVALITGAGRGIGRGIAQLLSQEGLPVGLTARSAEELAITAGGCAGRTASIAADLTADGAVESIFDRAEASLGPISVLVLNAGAGVSARVHKTTDAQWEQMLALNLTAPFRCVRRALPAMLDHGWGRIVVVSSVAGKIGEPYIAAYTASKHGVLGLVRSAAAELVGTGVTINAVCPGYVDTPMTDATVASIVARGRTEEEARAILAAKQPSGRLVTIDEVASAVWTLITDGSANGEAMDVW